MKRRTGYFKLKLEKQFFLWKQYSVAGIIMFVVQSISCSHSINRKTGMLILLFLTVNCSEKEPNFTVKGNSSITKDIKINIEMFKDTSKTITTAYYDGQSYDIDNAGVLRYKIYVSYQNKYFCTIEMDNLHHKLKGKPVNEIVFLSKNDVVTALYIGNIGNTKSTGTNLLPADIFFKDKTEQTAEKQKFIAFYNK